MTRGADVLGAPVMEEPDRKLGTVVDVLFDDNCTRVVGFVFKCGLFGRRRVVGFSDVIALQSRRVLVRCGGWTRARSAEELGTAATNRRAMQGRPVVSRQGSYLGQVADVLFADDGEVLAFAVGSPAARGRWRPRAILPTDMNPVVGRDVVIGP